MSEMITMYRLFAMLHVDLLARSINSYDLLLASIREKMIENRIGVPGSKPLYYVTTSAASLHRISDESVVWLFLLLYPTHPFIKKMDRKSRAILKGVRKLTSDDYRKFKVKEKLGCSGMIENYIYQSHEILSVGYDPKNHTLDPGRCISICKNEKSAAELYNVYVGCGLENARQTIRQYLMSQAPSLKQVCDDGIYDIDGGEVVLRFDFSSTNRKEIWESIPHLFFQTHSRDPERLAGLFFDYLMDQGQFRYALSTAYYHPDGRINYRGFNSTGQETDFELSFRYYEQYSYHDGGGSYETHAGLKALTEEQQRNLMIPAVLETKNYRIPDECGHWHDDRYTYLVNPFEMDGVFILVQ